MRVCKSPRCGRIFSEYELERIPTDRSVYMGMVQTNFLPVCPFCHSTEHEEAERCDGCGGYGDGDSMIRLGWKLLCLDCFEKELRIHSDKVTQFFLDNPDDLELLSADYFPQEREKK